MNGLKDKKSPSKVFSSKESQRLSGDFGAQVSKRANAMPDQNANGLHAPGDL